ncbi:hypothetical protein ACTJI2_01190 [Pseudoxanthomonas sp. 22568]|uniref:hypothetical protein n=1 Tax=Pseudoxanthomonas sp. 22568 TaxID=3453945 RepID=UPI003F84FED5
MNPITGTNFNRYWYANNSPYRFTDPDGRIAYQNGNTVVIPVYYQGAGATPDFIAGQVKAASKLVTEDGTKFQIIPLSKNIYPLGNVMDVSPGQNLRTPKGEGVIPGFNGSVAHIDSMRPDVAGATLHDTLHFVPGLGDPRKSDGYLETKNPLTGAREFAGYKKGFGPDQIMANTSGNILRAHETSFMKDANNGLGSKQDLDKIMKLGK